MKKLLPILVVTVLLLMSVTTAFADAHHGTTKSTATKYAVCSVRNCTITGVHTHNGISCAAHYYGDGHTYHTNCDVASCTQTGYHSHNGTYCFGNPSNNGYCGNGRGGCGR